MLQVRARAFPEGDRTRNTNCVCVPFGEAKYVRTGHARGTEGECNPSHKSVRTNLDLTFFPEGDVLRVRASLRGTVAYKSEICNTFGATCTTDLFPVPFGERLHVRAPPKVLHVRAREGVRFVPLVHVAWHRLHVLGEANTTPIAHQK